MLVGELGRREIEHAVDQAFGDERLHGLAAAARGVEDEHFVTGALEHGTRALHARCRHAEHRRRDDRLVGGRGCRGRQRHQTSHRPRRLRQHGPADAVDAGDVRHGIQHEDVLVAHELANGPGRQRAEHHLGHAQGQRAHRRGRDRGPGRTTQAEHTAELARGEGFAGQMRGAGRRERHGLAPIGTPPDVFERRAGEREDAIPGDISRNGWLPERANVHERHAARRTT